jgi:hypothetical protein
MAVKPESEMDSETFLKHMNARHVPVVGIEHFGKSNVPGDEDEALLRALHNNLHTTSMTNHEHGRKPE